MQSNFFSKFQMKVENKYGITIAYWSMRTIAVTGYLLSVLLLIFTVFMGNPLYDVVLLLAAAFLLIIPFRLTLHPLLFYPRLIFLIALSVFLITRVCINSGESFDLFNFYYIILAITGPVSLLIRRYIKLKKGIPAVLIGVFIGLVIPLSLESLSVWQIMNEADYYQDYIGTRLNQELGFEHGSPYYQLGGRTGEVFELQNIKPGGIMDRAGVRDGDIVINYSFTGLYRTLQKNRGKHFEFYVVDGGDGPLLNKRNRRKIQIDIPK